jgi:Tol biopolymer transport system component
VTNGGKVAAFTSSASNLVPGDVNHAEDVFLRRVTTGVTTRITLTPDGHRMTRGADVTDLTPDGRYVLLDVNGRPMNVRPMVLNRSTSRASWVTSSIPIGARGGGSLAISDDGRIVLNRFEYDLFIVNRARHEVRGGPEARFWASLAVLSGDGRWMAYPSTEVRRAQVYVRDRFAGRRTLVSRGLNGRPARGNSIFPSLSKHGRFVAFSSTAANLARGDTNGASDVFVRDRARHRTFMLTRGGGPGVRRKGSFDPDISANGRYVAFTSASGNLVRKDSNGLPDVFVRDRRSGTTCLVSVGVDGRSAGGVSRAPEISADGRFVAFLSGAPNLVAGDTNRHVDGFVARVPTTC